MKHRVVITGIGCVTPLGTSVTEMWQQLVEGKSGVGKTTIFDATSFPTQIAAEVHDWSIADVGEDPQIDGLPHLGRRVPGEVRDGTVRFDAGDHDPNEDAETGHVQNNQNRPKGCRLCQEVADRRWVELAEQVAEAEHGMIRSGPRWSNHRLASPIVK